jgi:hypothetical protein
VFWCSGSVIGPRDEVARGSGCGDREWLQCLLPRVVVSTASHSGYGVYCPVS